MTRRSDAQLAGRLACCLLTLALAACTQGYPADDAPRADPFEMSNRERLAALNELAQEAHPDRRWEYSMQRPCELHVEYRRKGSPAAHATSKLVRAMDADLAFDEQDQTFDVVLRASSHRDAEAVATLLESREWTDASQAALYLKLLIRDCERPAA